MAFEKTLRWKSAAGIVGVSRDGLNGGKAIQRHWKHTVTEVTSQGKHSLRWGSRAVARSSTMQIKILDLHAKNHDEPLEELFWIAL